MAHSGFKPAAFSKDKIIFFMSMRMLGVYKGIIKSPREPLIGLDAEVTCMFMCMSPLSCFRGVRSFHGLKVTHSGSHCCCHECEQYASPPPIYAFAAVVVLSEEEWPTSSVF